MKKTICLLCLLGLATLHAQEENDSSDAPPTPQGSYLTVNILSPIAFETPRYRFGYILPLNKKWMVGLDAGYGDQSITFTTIDRIKSEDYRLFEFRTEIYYILPVARKSIHYLSLEVGYLNHQETFFDDFFKSGPSDTKIAYDSADYERIRGAITLKYGAFYELWEQIGLNVYYGIGVRQRDNSYLNIVESGISQSDESPSVDDDRNEYGFFNDYYRREGKHIGLNLQLGFKLYYQFK